MRRRVAGLGEIVDRFPSVRMVVAGDLIADEFIYGRIDRVSREAPVLILKYDSTEIVPGGAGNAANNAASLGARVTVVGVAGRDEAGTRMMRALGDSTNVKTVVRPAGFATPVKTRILAGGIHSAKQQVVRIDRAGGALARGIARQVQQALTRAARSADVVVISDYGGRLVTPEMWHRALKAAARRTPPMVLVDSRYGLKEFTGLTACTPNEPEVEALLGVRIGDDREMLERAGRMLLGTLACRAVLITRGSRGMALFQPDAPTEHIPIVGSDQVTDVTGAGDTVIATFALALAAGASFADAARIANHAGCIVVMKRGTAIVTRDELLESLAKPR